MTLAYLNDVMTVQQLIDLVAFLQASYQLVPPPVSPYSYISPVTGGDLSFNHAAAECLREYARLARSGLATPPRGSVLLHTVSARERT